jgi:hypothetical protein
MKVKKEYYDSTRSELISVSLPEETRTYKPITHEQVMDLTLESIYQAGLTVEREEYRSGREGNVATGSYYISTGGDSEMQLKIVWQNSYDRSRPLIFGIGANVIVCTNMMMAFRAINSFKKKHTGEIQTFAPGIIPEYIKGAGEVFLGLQKDKEAMKQIPVDRRMTAEILGRLHIEKEILEPTQLNIIRRELDKPTHKYNSPGSLWELYQFTTFAIGGIHPSRWLSDHVEAHEFFSEIAGLWTSEAEIVQPTIVIPDTQLSLFDDDMGKL